MNRSFLIENVKLDLGKTMVSNFKYANSVADKQYTMKINGNDCLRVKFSFLQKVNNSQPIKQIGNKGFFSDNLFGCRF